MGITTGIEWCDSTLNLQMGCDGCELWIPKLKIKKCYAGKLTQLRAGQKGYPPAFERPAIFPARLAEAERWPNLRGTVRPDKPWLNGLPRLIFLDDMGDTFTESLPLDWLAEFLPRMAALPHIVILLTKRANRMHEFSRAHPFPPNFWLLVSVTSAANYNRIPQLLSVRGGSVLGISYEPAWGAVDFSPWLPLHAFGRRSGWIIGGGESGAGAKPSQPDWFRCVRDQCVAAGVPFFFKQWGRFAPVGQTMVPSKLDQGRMLDGREWSQFPDWYRSAEVVSAARI
jgi:protein gp37